MVAPGGPSGNSEVVTFGSAAGEDDLGGRASEQFGYGLAGVLNGCPRFLSMMMDRRGVAEALQKVRTHGFEHFGQDRSGGVVVEIDAVHTEPASILRDSEDYPTLMGRDVACYVLVAASGVVVRRDVASNVST